MYPCLLRNEFVYLRDGAVDKDCDDAAILSLSLFKGQLRVSEAAFGTLFCPIIVTLENTY